MFSPAFERIFAGVLAAEGGFSADPRDPGNWTGGRCGVGECRGTNFGLSAASYPSLELATITEPEALAVYHRDYWLPIRGDELPLPVAWLVADGAVNSGVGAAVRWLQAAAGSGVDGALGEETLAAVRGVVARGAGPFFELLIDISQRRLMHLSESDEWAFYRAGWTHRVLETHSHAVAAGAFPAFR